MFQNIIEVKVDGCIYAFSAMSFAGVCTSPCACEVFSPSAVEISIHFVSAVVRWQAHVVPVKKKMVEITTKKRVII